MKIALDTSNNNPATTYQMTVANAAALICKATEWSTAGGLFRDPDYFYQRSVARRVGVPFGAYLFMHANVDGAAQARAFLEFAQPRAGDLQPVVDVENADGRPWQDIARTLLDCLGELERHGYRPLVYASASWWLSLVAVAPELKRFGVWEAQYPGAIARLVPRLAARRWKLRHGASVKLWQFTDRYNVAGSRFDASLILVRLSTITIPSKKGKRP